MEDYDIFCDLCDGSFSRLEAIDQYLVDAHTMEFRCTGRYCPQCARIERERRTWGQAEDWAVEAFSQGMLRHYGDPVEVTWLQGDEHRWLFHVRRVVGSER